MGGSIKLSCLKIKRLGLCGLNCPILEGNKCPELKKNADKKNNLNKERVPDFLQNMFGGFDI